MNLSTVSSVSGLSASSTAAGAMPPRPQPQRGAESSNDEATPRTDAQSLAQAVSQTLNEMHPAQAAPASAQHALVHEIYRSAREASSGSATDMGQAVSQLAQAAQKGNAPRGLMSEFAQYVEALHAQGTEAPPAHTAPQDAPHNTPGQRAGGEATAPSTAELGQFLHQLSQKLDGQGASLKGTGQLLETQA